MKTYIKFLFIVVGISSVLMAFIQTSTINTSRMLINIDWKLQDVSNNGYSMIERFNEGELTTKFIQGYDTTVSIASYYLSDTLVKIFNPREVRALRRGEYKYIVVEDGEKSREPKNPTLIYEILNLNSDSLEIQYIPRYGEIIREGRPVTYKPLKK